MNSRETALTVLGRCRRDGAWSGAVLDNEIKKAGLSERDAALTSALSLGVIQNTTLCDFYIDSFCEHKLEPKVRDILRLGVYQLLFMDRIPANAAVNECVKLCDRRTSGLVNAVLRRVSAGSESLPKIPGEGTAKYLSIRYSHPEWLVTKMIAEQGYEFTEAFLSSANKAAVLTLHINTLKISANAYKKLLFDAGISFTDFVEEPPLVELRGGRVEALPGYSDGLFFVQDRAAAAAVSAAGILPGMSVLDACSAPGGKSFAAAMDMNGSGEIISCDIHEKKLSLIERGAERLGIEIIKTNAKDARVFEPEFKGHFDVVISDVPCSGFGVIRKKPEIRRKNSDEIVRLPQIQIDILNNLAEYVAPGGVLLYSTCTIFKEENEAVVLKFLQQNKEFRLERFNGAPDGMRTFWPHIDNTDGFFAAKLRKS